MLCYSVALCPKTPQGDPEWSALFAQFSINFPSVSLNLSPNFFQFISIKIHTRKLCDQYLIILNYCALLISGENARKRKIIFHFYFDFKSVAANFYILIFNMAQISGFITLVLKSFGVLMYSSLLLNHKKSIHAYLSVYQIFRRPTKSSKFCNRGKHSLFQIK